MYTCICVDLLRVALIIKVRFCNLHVLPRSHGRFPKAFPKPVRSTKSLREATPKGSSRLLNHKSKLQAMETKENQGYRSPQAY